MRGACGLLAIAAVSALAGKAQAGEPTFKEVAAQSNIEHVYDGGWAHFVGGGVAVFDCDGDHLPDIYAAGGENPAVLLRNASTPGGAIRFTPVEHDGALKGVIGAYPLDVDGDGIIDLFVLRDGTNRLLRGEGDCRFAPADDLWKPSEDTAWSTAFSATWEPGERLPTLAIGNYVDRADPEGPFRACAPHRLIRPEGEAYGAPVPFGPGHCALSMLFFDWSGTGQTALWVSNDRHYYVDEGQEQLFRLASNPTLYGPQDGWQPVRLWGMGIAARDLSGDGRPEVFITSIADQKLLSIDGDGTAPHYGEAGFKAGTTAHRPYLGDDGRPSTGWHAAFGDVNNDGRDDLFIAKGNVDQMPDNAMLDPDNLLMQQEDGSFIERGEVAGIASTARGRGAALVDLNADGRLDIVVVNRRAPLLIHQNTTRDAGNWLKLQLTDQGPNTGAVGAVIELRSANTRQRREITVGGGHAGGDAGFHHFGLGTDERATYRITWPDGTTEPWRAAASNAHLVVARTADGVTVTPVAP